MSQFVTELSTTCIDDLACDGRGIWRVDFPFIYQSDILGKTITVEYGFLTDFNSTPRLPIAFLLFGNTSQKSAVIHDWLYHHHEVCDEKTANKVLLEAMTIEGIPSWRANGIYYGVFLGGKSSWEEDGTGNGHSIVNGRIV